VLAIAERIAGVPKDLTQINKRSVHRSFEIMGARSAIRAATEMQALAGHTQAAAAVRGDIMSAVKQTTGHSSAAAASPAEGPQASA
jgi:enoyl-CoA hydratase